MANLDQDYFDMMADAIIRAVFKKLTGILDLEMLLKLRKQLNKDINKARKKIKEVETFVKKEGSS